MSNTDAEKCVGDELVTTAENQKDVEEKVSLKLEGLGSVEVDADAAVLEVDRRYATVRVEAKADEVHDANFPPHLHAAFQLFCMTRCFNQAQQLKRDTDAFMNLLELGPSGSTSQSMGRACVCWGCGRVGLPKNPEGSGAPQCTGCGEDDQTNFVKVLQPNGTFIPWMEEKVGPEQQAAADAAKDKEKENGEARSQPQEGGKKVKCKPNEKCNCGSEKKFKKCCGANA
mmetsp:Transcript_35953/g.49912  ORF Transcript_35953/g.49912 Transcript_35953/m.49912 type:complete len:228 (-) Transcript_35953:19-702(-)|eukprot:CAMPEP_0196579604 /NCGR_PEP_ID=MMETSP1081-20130531/23383_1 /TAXON_ID=36882 /ORGANISM="Pyramimonas amylifera, Strain CCMP720" /LENGTH=227 /DNA_ID=CAMNT_0041899237 /DNA_START=134 /DNA_END=817 /DNA_ORIENTATION=+